jgi:hypothetical protein
MDHYAPYGVDAIVLGGRQVYSFDQRRIIRIRL